jgi:hypothetical protein
LADDEKSPGLLTLLVPVAQRDDPRPCPKCSAPLARITVPKTIGELWGNPYNKKKTTLGPSDNIYPPLLEKRRKEANPTRHVDMSPRAQETRREVAAETKRAPAASEVPKPGVSVARSK